MRGLRSFLPVGLTFLTLAAYAWLFGGARATVLRPVMPWIWALTLEGLLFFPQGERWENELDARDRTWRRLSRSSLLYLVFAFGVVLLFPLFNAGLCPRCDRALIAAGASAAPPVPYAPYCIRPLEHWGVVLWFLPALTAVLAARYALVRRGRRLLVEMLVWNGALLALFGFLEQWTGAQAPWWRETAAPVHFFSTFGYPNMAGSYFTFLFAVSCGLWRQRVADALAEREGGTVRRRSSMAARTPAWIRTHYPLAAALLNFLAALESLSRASALLVSALAAFWFLYALLGAFTRRRSANRMRMAAVELVALAGLALATCVFAPKGLRKELATVSDVGVADRISGKNQPHSAAAWAIFRDHPLFGAGGWGYMHLCTDKMTPAERNSLPSTGGANVHNDYLQFLCEHGAVGFGLLLAIVLALTAPTFGRWGRLVRMTRFSRVAAGIPRPRALYVLPPPVLGILLGALAVAVHAFGDCPLRSPAVLSAVLCALACADGFMAKDEDEE